MSCALILGICLLQAFQFTPEEIADREKWENFLQTSEIVGEKQLGTGNLALAPWRLSLEKDGMSGSAIWKNLEGRIGGFLEGWKWEIAAYRLDKFLGLHMVPPTVEREYLGKQGCLQLWVTAELDMWIKTRDKIQIPSHKVFSWNKETYLQRAFDNLIANYDRHGGNVLITKDWRMILVDHSRSFGTTKNYTSRLIYTENYKAGPREMKSLPRVFVEKLKGLDFETLKKIVEEYLTAAEIEAVLIRRDLILDEIARLIEKYGEDNVLY